MNERQWIIVITSSIFLMVILYSFIRGYRWDSYLQKRFEEQSPERDDVRIKCREILNGTNIVVIVREKNGSVSSLESLVIQELIELTATVKHVSPKVTSQIWSNFDNFPDDCGETLFFIGTVCKTYERTAYQIFSGNEYECIDFRIVTSERQIIGSDNVGAYLEADLVFKVVRSISVCISKNKKIRS